MTSDKTPEEARAYQIMTTRKKQNKSYQKEKGNSFSLAWIIVTSES